MTTEITIHPAGATVGGKIVRWWPAPLPKSMNDMGDVRIVTGHKRDEGILLRDKHTGDYLIGYGHSARRLDAAAVTTALDAARV